MKLFKNINFTKRDYECTNMVYCMADTPPGPQWEEVTGTIPSSMQMLERCAGVEYYGWL